MTVKLRKFNPNHGPDGKFSSGPSQVDTSEARTSWNVPQVKPIFGQGSKPGDLYTATTSSLGYKITNSLGINTETGAKYTFVVDGFSTSLRRFNITDIKFESLEGDTLAQCRFGWAKNADGSSASQAIMVFDPTKTQAITNMWTKDQADIKAGKTPWGAISYARNQDELLTATVLHEYAHGTLSDYTLKQPRDTWIDPEDPMNGTKEWKDTVHTAATAGWQPPSQYSKQNYAEMFAECSVAIGINKTTGNKQVDAYVEKVNAK